MGNGKWEMGNGRGVAEYQLAPHVVYGTPVTIPGRTVKNKLI